MRVLVIKGRRVNSIFLAREISRGLLLGEGFRDKAAATKAKTRISHPKMGGTSCHTPTLAWANEGGTARDWDSFT